MSEKIRYNSILVPIDGSVKSFEAVQYTIKIASLFSKCVITLCYVINVENIRQISTYQNINSDDLYNKYSKQAEKYFNKAIHEAKMKGYDENLIKTNILFGDPADEIIKFAPNFNLIVIALRGKKHVTEYIMGHVTERVINLSGVPVLVIP